MNETDLNSLLRRAAAVETQGAEALQGAVMARVRVDEGRQRRWRSFVVWLLALAIVSGVITAVTVGWTRALRDETHARPPRLELSSGGLGR